jgi:exopolysaccharide biosynthesis protein
MKRWNLVLLYLGIFLTIYGQENVSQDSISFIHAAWVHDTLANGVIHKHFHFDSKQIFNSNQNIHILRVAKNAADVKWKIGSAGDELIKTSIIAQKEEALAAVNGSFFNMKKGGSVNFIRINGIMTDTSATKKARESTDKTRPAHSPLIIMNLLYSKEKRLLMVNGKKTSHTLMSWSVVQYCS